MSRPSAFTWAAERYAAGERLAKAARALQSELLAIPPMFATPKSERAAAEMVRALAEYERTRDAP